ncbi:MAG: hypothetical protein JOZ69_24045, partial [Myxococcales bacterium]|nr:hypothetical protein [Myxococcales bacterium]
MSADETTDPRSSRARARGWACATLALAVLGCSRPVAERGEAGALDEAPPAPPEHAEATVRRIDGPEEVPLRGPRVDARAGDWSLEGLGGVAVVSSSRGSVVDFGAKDGEDALVSLDPTLFLGLEQATSVVESVAAAGAGAHAVLVRKRILSEPPLRLWTYVTFAGGALRLESVATASDQPALAVTLGEVVGWGNVPTWVEGHGFVHGKETWSGDFIAREGLGVAYALAPDQGHVVARFAAGGLGFHEFARTGEGLAGVPARGASSRRVILVTQARGHLGEAVRLLPRFAGGPSDTHALPAGLPERSEAEVARCDGGPFARFAAGTSGLWLPRECFRVRLLANGHAPGSWLSPEELRTAPPDVALPRAGRLRWRIREKGGAADVPLPARLLVRGLAGTADPDWGDEPSEGASLDVIHADRDGERAIPAGRYHVTISRGFEYTLSEADVTVVVGKTALASADLQRVVDTRGWLAADLHVHAVPSMDAPAPLPDRVQALAAAGVEVAVATDHNVLTDYGPTIRERGLTRWLSSVVGDEVTTRGVPMGHFNVFPLAVGAPPVPYERVTATAMAAAARAAPPEGPKVVQLNHPRMGGIGYFE